MKKVLSFSLSILILSSCFTFLFSCTPNQKKEKFELDLTGYVANISDATAIGLVNQSSAEVSSLSSNKKQSLSFGLTVYAEEDDDDYQNYLVMSTSYDSNDPETDETGLKKVSFTKTVTGTEKIVGNKFVWAWNSSISVAASEGFTYSVYLDNELVIANIQDNDSNDKNHKKQRELIF